MYCEPHLPPMMSMVVIADSSSDAMAHLTWLPFRLWLTPLTVILDIRAELPGPESLVKVNITELMTTGSASTPMEPRDETDRKDVVAPLSGFAMNCHECDCPDVVHVSSSWSPAWQTGATTEGEISGNAEGKLHTNFITHMHGLQIYSLSICTRYLSRSRYNTAKEYKLLDTAYRIDAADQSSLSFF